MNQEILRTKNNKMKFIGGLIYTGEDLEEERIRLEEFFKKLCIKLSISYPNDRNMQRKERLC